MGAPAARVSELSRYWAKEGHEVTVLTGFPNHPTGVVPPEYRSKLRRLVMREHVDGVNVVRSWLFPFPNRKAYERVLNYSSFCVSSASTGAFLPRLVPDPHAKAPGSGQGAGWGIWLSWVVAITPNDMAHE